ncbi:MAG: glutamine--tRNA ligase/YqeY domain fusion protein [Pseudomonadota bacterium]
MSKQDDLVAQGQRNADADSVQVKHFLQQTIDKDIDEGRLTGPLVTRFPPEPNGYLHIGHAKSICLNFGLAQEYGGVCHLRFDDTNPEKESDEFIRSIKEDVEWLGFEWHGDIRFASNYFDQLHELAIQLVQKGHAYVCDLTADQAREHRGTLTQPGINSPYRERSVDENLALFEKMRQGDFEEGACVLRAKIDMASPNMNLRDPIMYRIRKIKHHQTGDQWCIYPTYDFTHGQSDAIEGITHSICTLEFEDHRPLYEWYLERLDLLATPRQIEFARLNLNYTVTSKRKLKRLVDENIVSGWDDPRMPTISGLRRRGFTPHSLRQFCQMIGVSRNDSCVDVGMLEFAIRDELDKQATRAMCVMDPVKLVITNYPEDKVEELIAPAHPQQDMGERVLPFTREIMIDRADFREEANKKYKRLVLNNGIRLRNGYVVYAEDVVKDANGDIVEIYCTYDENTLGKKPEGERKVRGVIHWVSATHGKRARVNVYDRLFSVEFPDKEDDLLDGVNAESLTLRDGCYIEPSLLDAAPEQRFQFEREGYFVADRYDHSHDSPVFNKIIGLRDTWAKK